MTTPVFSEVVPDIFGIGECPVWDAERECLLWTSIDDCEIHELTPRSRARRKWKFPSATGSFGICASGRLVVGLANDVILFDRQTGEQRLIASIKHAVPEARLNDGKVGPDGAFWVGSMDLTHQRRPIGALYRVDPRGSVTTIATGICVSNGLTWARDGTVMYFADSRGIWIDSWRFDPRSGAVSGRKRFLDLDLATGRPDGAATDADGNLWYAGPSANRLNCFAPDGRLVATVPMPNYKPTMPCFGGADLKTIFVPSLSVGLSADELAQHPQAGKILSFSIGAKGLPGYLFRDV